jgi:hypothetical protein
VEVSLNRFQDFVFGMPAKKKGGSRRPWFAEY